MAEKDLINLGTSPDSGTGDSARRGGEKINNLFADIYANLGSNPIGNDPSGDYYGYARTYEDFDYKVGEIHPAGRFYNVEFDSDGARVGETERPVTRGTDGWGSDSEVVDGIPNVYRNLSWYFLSRGERISADLTNIADTNSIHFVLPLAVEGDVVIIRDATDSWDGKTIKFWTTPYEFTAAKLTEWKEQTGYDDPNDNTVTVTYNNVSRVVPYKSFTGAVNFTFNNTESNDLVVNGGNGKELVCIYGGPTKGWTIRETFDSLIVDVPASPSADGVEGQIAFDSDGIYRRGSSQWGRIAWDYSWS